MPRNKPHPHFHPYVHYAYARSIFLPLNAIHKFLQLGANFTGCFCVYLVESFHMARTTQNIAQHSYLHPRMVGMLRYVACTRETAFTGNMALAQCTRTCVEMLVTLCINKLFYKREIVLYIRASVDALCRDGAVQISRERVQRGRLIRQRTRS